MAFCTSCGATVTGAFCNQCGTPASAASGPAAAPPVAAVPVKRKTSPLVWVLIIILGLFVLGGIGMVGVGYFVVHKARQAGIDPDLMRRNPGLAVSKMIAAMNPDVEVVSTDDGAGTITIRDKKTGKTVTMNFDQAQKGKFTFSAQGDDGKTASVEIGEGAGKLPSWVPTYPGAKVEGTFAVKGDTGDSTGEGGTVSFTTTDAGSKVMAFYQDKCKELGLKIALTTATNEGGMIIATDEGEKRSLQIVVGGGSGKTTVGVTYGLKK
jgi:hypothetical protein